MQVPFYFIPKLLKTTTHPSAIDAQKTLIVLFLFLLIIASYPQQAKQLDLKTTSPLIITI